jgi:urea transport system substrate-binding protein
MQESRMPRPSSETHATRRAPPTRWLPAATMLALLAATALPAARAAEGPIKIGVPVGLSGANSVVAPSVVQAAQLAVAEINAKGGVLGHKLELVVADDGSGADGAVKAFGSLIFRQHVNVLISMETSAARNAGLPVVARGHTPYIYTSYYEGHSCSPDLYVDAWVPEQQVPPVIDYFMQQKQAKTFFLVGSDYAFGRGMLDFTRKYILAHGGKIVGEEYLPMDASDWTPVLSKLRAAHPDALVSSTAGGAPNVTLTKQLRAAGINVLFGNLAEDEGTAKAIGADAAGTYLSQSYFTRIDNPKNQAFKAALEKMFGANMKTPNDLSEPEYDGIYLYKAAVEKAKSTDPRKVLAQLATVSFDGPRGMVKMSDQHHAPLTMYLGQVQQDGSVKVIQKFPDVSPGAQCPALK